MYTEFIEQVQKYFKFLSDDYGFSVSATRIPEGYGTSRVNYESNDVGVEVDLDRGEVSFWIGPLRSPDDWLDLAQLIPFVYPAGIGEPAYVYPESWEGCTSHIEWQVARLAKVVRQYLDCVLRGEFTAWTEVIRSWRDFGDTWYKQFLKEGRRQ